LPSKTYQTIQGDTWDYIAYKTLGSEYLLPLLLEANQEHREIFIFPSNVTIKVPEMEKENTVQLPPWMEDDA
jgi:phage tail protein X